MLFKYQLSMKPATFSKIYMHIVFAVKFRQALIQPEWEDELFKFITGVISKRGQKLYIVNGWFDHIHLLLSLEGDFYLPYLVRDIKRSSTEFIRRRGFTRKNFRWQEGYGAFSHDDRCLNNVIGYIERQKEHHMKKDFRKEYEQLLKKYGVSYRKSQLFKLPE